MLVVLFIVRLIALLLWQRKLRKLNHSITEKYVNLAMSTKFENKMARRECGYQAFDVLYEIEWLYVHVIW